MLIEIRSGVASLFSSHTNILLLLRTAVHSQAELVQDTYVRLLKWLFLVSQLQVFVVITPLSSQRDQRQITVFCGVQ